MNLGVIICPKCRQATGINLDSRYINCPRCKKGIMVKIMKIQFKSCNHRDIRDYVQQLNQRLILGD